jgi:hypothetical protein
MEQVLDEVLLRYSTDELKHNLLAGIDQGKPLVGSLLIGQWQNRTAEYPDALALAIVKKYAQIDHFWRWEMWLHRGNNLMMLYHSFSQIQHKLLQVLLALNRVYYFGFKWPDVVVARLTLAPRDLGTRVYDLIEQTLPSVNVAWLREVFRYRRPLWEEAPAPRA